MESDTIRLYIGKLCRNAAALNPEGLVSEFSFVHDAQVPYDAYTGRNHTLRNKPASPQGQRLLEGNQFDSTAKRPTTTLGAAGAVEPVHHRDYTSADASDWAHLATELLQMLTVHLEAKEIRPSRLVCRHWWLHISAECKAFGNPVQLDLCPGSQDWLMKVEALRRIFPGLQQCALLISSRRSQSEVEARMQALTSWTQLTSLQVQHWVPDDPRLGADHPQLAETLCCLTSLRALDLSRGVAPQPADILALTALVNLEELRMIFHDVNPCSGGLIRGEHVRAIAKLTSLKQLEFEASHDMINDSDLASLTSLSRLQSLSVVTGIVKVKGQELQELSKLTRLSTLNLSLVSGSRRNLEPLVVTNLAACPALKDIKLTILWSERHKPPPPPLPHLLQAVATHLTAVLTSLHIQYHFATSHLVVNSHVTLLAQLTALKSLAVDDSDAHRGGLSHFSVLSTLTRLQSFSLCRHTNYPSHEQNMDKVALDRLCSSWGGQLTHLSLIRVGASASHDLACAMRSLRSLSIDPPLITRMLACLRPSFAPPPSPHLPTALTSLVLSNTKLRCFRTDWMLSDVAWAIQMFVRAFMLHQQMYDGMVAGWVSDACQAVAGALYVCAKAATDAGGTFPDHILARLNAAAAGSRGVCAAAPHLLQCTQLKHLSLNDCEIEPTELVALLLSCPVLESLDLTNVASVCEAHVAVMGQLKQLGCITLCTKTSWEHVPEVCIRYLALSPDLRILNVDMAALHTRDLGFAARDALKGMQRLYELTCAGCKDHDAITDVLRCLPHADMSTHDPNEDTDSCKSNEDDAHEFGGYDDHWDDLDARYGSSATDLEAMRRGDH